jgi:hypothetical protein
MSLRLKDWSLTPEQQQEQQELILQQLTANLSPAARKYFYQQIIPAISAKVNKSFTKPYNDSVALDFYDQDPVGIVEFIRNPYYLGSRLRDSIFQPIEDDLVELFSGEYSEVLLKGAIGWGKTTFAYIGIAYDIYKVSCMRHPAKSFGLIPGTALAFINISVRLMQAKRILFGGLLNMIRSSPYFNEKFAYDKTVESELRFPRGLIAYPVAANEQSILGEGVFSAAMDEINFYQHIEKSAQDPEGGNYDQAVVLYNKISSRIRSRMNQRGNLPGHLWMLSSSRYPTEFTEVKAQEAITDKRIFVREHTVWDTKPKHFFMTEAFQVEVGDISRRSRVLTGIEVNVNIDRVIDVPLDFRKEFDTDTDKAVRDLAGISILTISPYISKRELIAGMFAAGEKMGLKHPFSSFSATLQDPSEHLIPENLHWIEVLRKLRGKPEELVRQIHGGPYFFHVDLALNRGGGDAAGFCVCHVVGSKKIERGYGPEKRIESRPIIRLDLVLQIVAPPGPGGEILLSNIRGLLYRMRELGMQFGKGSYDSWNSVESLQTLKSEGFTVDTYSVDREPAAYEALREAIYDGRVEVYPHPILKMELATLIMDYKKNKIDHIQNGSKDTSDAVAGAMHHAEEAFTGGSTSEWQNALTVNSVPVSGVKDDQEELWDKVNRGIPLSPEEIARLK